MNRLRHDGGHELSENASVSRRFFLLAASLALWLPTAALAGDADQVAALPFTEHNRATIVAGVTRPDVCASLLEKAIAQRLSRTAGKVDADIRGVSLSGRVCQVVSLNHDGRLEVMASADLYGGNGPLSLVVVFKRSGLLDEVDIPIGEGNGNLGPVDLSLQDLNHDGSLEVVETVRTVYPDGRMAVTVAPAPTVTNVYVWRNNGLVEATPKFRPFIAGTVLPALRRDLAKAQTKTGTEAGQLRVNALNASVYYAERLVATGRY
jgi:hypothetical protein